MQSIKALSLSFKNADLLTRGKMQFSEQEIQDFLALYTNHAAIKSVLLLSTCNRTELYFESSEVTCGEMLTHLLAFKQTSIDTHLFRCFETTEDACKYILEVSVGLHSMVLGDKQIFQQLKKAYQNSQNAGVISGIFERLFQQIAKIHKRIQNETLFLKGSQSTSYLAVEQAKKKIGTKAKVLLVGAGEMAQDVAKYLHTLGFSHVVISNRSPQNAQKILGQHPNFSFIPFETLQEKFAEFDVVISSVGVANLITNEWILEQTQNKLLIDLGVPASIHVQHSSIKVIHLDALAATITLHKNQSQAAVAEVNHIIEQELAGYLHWVKRLPVNKLLTALKNHYRQTLVDQFTQYNETLPDQVLESLVNALIKKPALNLKNMELPDSLQTVAQLQQVYHL